MANPSGNPEIAPEKSDRRRRDRSVNYHRDCSICAGSAEAGESITVEDLVAKHEVEHDAQHEAHDVRCEQRRATPDETCR